MQRYIVDIGIKKYRHKIVIFYNSCFLIGLFSYLCRGEWKHGD